MESFNRKCNGLMQAEESRQQRLKAEINTMHVIQKNQKSSAISPQNDDSTSHASIHKHTEGNCSTEIGKDKRNEESIALQSNESPKLAEDKDSTYNSGFPWPEQDAAKGQETLPASAIGGDVSQVCGAHSSTSA
jgi:hypothetical protein